MTPDRISILGVGIALAGLIPAGQRQMRAGQRQLWREMEQLRAETAELRRRVSGPAARLFRLEGESRQSSSIARR